jgi:hypothetical protein
MLKYDRKDTTLSPKKRRNSPSFSKNSVLTYACKNERNRKKILGK